jgi:hypothetical protein
MAGSAGTLGMVATLIAGISIPVHAEVTGGPPNVKPARQHEWTCSYPIVSNPSAIVHEQDFTVGFSVDDATGNAVVTRENVTVGVDIFSEGGGVTFVERRISGSARITTIDRWGSSVYSRHIILGGRLVPSQSYGRCTELNVPKDPIVQSTIQQH